MNKEYRDKIIELFEESRESSGDFFEPETIIQYLIKNPNGYDGIHNTFKGKGHFGKFIKKMEEHFTICFSLKDWESMYSLDQIEQRVIYLQQTPKSSLTSARNIIKQRPPEMLALGLFVICLPVVAIFVKISGSIGLISLAIPLGIIALLFKMHYKDIEFYEQIQNKIKANKASKGTQ